MAEGEYTRMSRVIGRGPSDKVSAMAAAEARLWERTGNAEYAERARLRIEAVLDHWEVVPGAERER